MFDGALPDLYSVDALKGYTAFDFERSLALNEARAVTNMIIAECWGGTVFLAVFGYSLSGYFPLIPFTFAAAYMLVRACTDGRHSLDTVARLRKWCELDTKAFGPC